MPRSAGGSGVPAGCLPGASQERVEKLIAEVDMRREVIKNNKEKIEKLEAKISRVRAKIDKCAVVVEGEPVAQGRLAECAKEIVGHWETLSKRLDTATQLRKLCFPIWTEIEGFEKELRGLLCEAVIE
jgi:hypothetical protein